MTDSQQRRVRHCRMLGTMWYSEDQPAAHVAAPTAVDLKPAPTWLQRTTASVNASLGWVSRPRRTRPGHVANPPSPKRQHQQWRLIRLERQASQRVPRCPARHQWPICHRLACRTFPLGRKNARFQAHTVGNEGASRRALCSPGEGILRSLRSSLAFTSHT